MSVVVKTSRGRNKPVSTTALWLVLGLAVAFFLVRFGQELLLEHDLKAKAAAQRIANAALQDENNRLKAALEYYRSDKYVEQRAREDLNLRRADEEVLIPIASEANSDAASDGLLASPGEIEQPTPTPEPANWQKWLNLFAPPPTGP